LAPGTEFCFGGVDLAEASGRVPSSVIGRNDSEVVIARPASEQACAFFYHPLFTVVGIKRLISVPWFMLGFVSSTTLILRDWRYGS
jgi:hypothetical protein